MSFLHFRVAFAIVLALLLTILPFPVMVENFRPNWIILLLLYFEIYLPSYSYASLSVLIGIILDVLLYTLIGQHAFILGLTLWFASTKTRRFYCFNLSQQIAFVGFLSFFYD